MLLMHWQSIDGAPMCPQGLSIFLLQEFINAVASAVDFS